MTQTGAAEAVALVGRVQIHASEFPALRCQAPDRHRATQATALVDKEVEEAALVKAFEVLQIAVNAVPFRRQTIGAQNAEYQFSDRLAVRHGGRPSLQTEAGEILAVQVPLQPAVRDGLEQQLARADIGIAGGRVEAQRGFPGVEADPLDAATAGQRFQSQQHLPAEPAALKFPGNRHGTDLGQSGLQDQQPATGDQCAALGVAHRQMVATRLLLRVGGVWRLAPGLTQFAPAQRIVVGKIRVAERTERDGEGRCDRHGTCSFILMQSLTEIPMRLCLITGLVALAVTACGGAGRTPIQPVYPAVPEAPYADKLRVCARALGPQRSCSLDELPLIGMESDAPDAALLMERVATTHDWMAQRFAELLPLLPPEILRLSRSLSAVIIGSDVRPSFYWRSTGAIYLDPANLWLSVEEKRSIDPEPDYRAGFGAQLNFHIISRYVLNNDYAWYGYSLSDDSERELADLIAPLSRLLFHELAHAADFFPAVRIPGLDPALNYEAAAQQIAAAQQQPSQNLEARYPLQSQTMFELARVNFFGQEPDDGQLALQPPDVTAHFSPDIASDDYSYSTRHEDLAMLFEELMMDYAFDIRRDVAVANRPAPGQQHIVDWGQRGRIGDAGVRPRVEQAAASLLPELDFSAYFASLGEPQSLQSGRSWNDNLDPSGQSKSTLRGQLQPRELDLVLPY